MMRSCFREERAANLRRVFSAGGLEFAAIGEQLDQSAQDLVIGSDADVFVQRALKLRAPAPPVLFDNEREVSRRLQMARIAGLEVSRRDTISTPVVHCQVSGQHYCFGRTRILRVITDCYGSIRLYPSASVKSAYHCSFDSRNWFASRRRSLMRSSAVPEVTTS